MTTLRITYSYFNQNSIELKLNTLYLWIVCLDRIEFAWFNLQYRLNLEVIETFLFIFDEKAVMVNRRVCFCVTFAQNYIMSIKFSVLVNWYFTDRRSVQTSNWILRYSGLRYKLYWNSTLKFTQFFVFFVQT